jgi:hypothetical protein
MAKIDGIEFDAQSYELIQKLIEKLKHTGTCEVYGLPDMHKKKGEIRLAHRLPTGKPKRGGGVFAQICPNPTGATHIRRRPSATEHRRIKLHADNLDEVFRDIDAKRKYVKTRQKISEKVDPGPSNEVSGGRPESNRSKF